MAGQLRIFTWNIHAGYHEMLTAIGHRFFLPFTSTREYNYSGLVPHHQWSRTATEIPAETARDSRFDLLIFHTPQQLLEEQYKILSPAQRRLPKLLVIHGPVRPRKSEYWKRLEKELAVVRMVIHITAFNRDCWEAMAKATGLASPPTTVIRHGIRIPEDVRWQGRTRKAATAINLLPRRPDCGPLHWLHVTKGIPTVLMGDDTAAFGGIGAVPHDKLPQELAKYRTYFNPTYRSSLQMAMLTAMSIGMPVVCRATGESRRVFRNGENGFCYREPARIREAIRQLLRDRSLAAEIGRNGQETIRKDFPFERFNEAWQAVLQRTVR